jgi:H+-transporting ATPase
MLSSLLLVWAALDSPNDGSLFQKMGLPVPGYGQIVLMIYLKVRGRVGGCSRLNIPVGTCWGAVQFARDAPGMPCTSMCKCKCVFTHPQVSLSDFLTLFSARTSPGFFWSARPAPILLAAGGVALAISTILACIWPSGASASVLSTGCSRCGCAPYRGWRWSEVCSILGWMEVECGHVSCVA